VTTLAAFGGSPVGSLKTHRTWPAYDEKAQAAHTRGLMTGPHGYGGPIIEEAQEQIAEQFGVRCALLVSNATAGLVAVQQALDLRGREVVQPAYSWQATPQATDAAGGIPVFTDIRHETFNIDPDKIEITPRTGAILAVSMHGLLAEPGPLTKLATRHGLPLIYDNAQAAGALAPPLKRGERPVNAGTSGTVAVLSLNHKKVWTALQGGVILTDDADLMAAIKIYAFYGMQLPDKGLPSYLTEYHGVNLAPPDSTASLAAHELPKVAGYVERARDNMRIIGEGVAKLRGLTMPQLPKGHTSTWSRPRVRLDPAALGWEGKPADLRDRVVAALRAEGLPVGPWQEWRLPAHPAWRRRGPLSATPHRLPERPVPLQADEFPTTTQMLETSFELAKHPHPLWVQGPDVAHHYAAAFVKVWEQMDEVLKPAFDVPHPQPRQRRI
jgi:dTDP-4-amino-4,6-dideoxygalactose transaminase